MLKDDFASVCPNSSQTHLRLPSPGSIGFQVVAALKPAPKPKATPALDVVPSSNFEREHFMAKNLWATSHAVESRRNVEGDGAYLTSRMVESATTQQEDGSPMSSSSICIDTGQVTSYNTDDLRTLLGQFRLSNERPDSQEALEPARSRKIHKDEVVMLDDELHGREGEWLVVADVSHDKRILTLHCYVSGTAFKRTADAVREDISDRRLKVLRYADPDVPPEWE